MQLDRRLKTLPSLEAPRGGWIRTIRQSLGMTMKQLARRLNVSPQAVLELETREKNANITLSKLRDVADALDCELRYVLIPRTSLDATVRRQASEKAETERNTLVHSMRLEAQSEGVEATLDAKRAVERWVNENIRRLWD